MSTDLVQRQSGGFDVAVIAPLSDLAERICRTEFVPAGLRGKPEATLAAMLTGDELGIKPMTALQKIHVIDGRPGLAAELMRALILQHGHDIWVQEKTTTRVTVAGCRKGSERVSQVTWTADDVKRAGLDGRPNHKRYPRAMLTARATAELARDIFPDLIGGLYALEELQDGFGFSDEDENVISIDADTMEIEQPSGHVRSTTKRAPAAKTSQSKPKESTTGPTRGSSTTEKERPPAPPIGNAATVPPTEPPVTETETGELADPQTVRALRERMSRLDDDAALLAFTEQWKQAAIGSIKEGAQHPLLASEVDRFTQILNYATEAFQDVAYEKRRKHANAAMSNVGIKGDDARHALVKEATDDETESTKELSKMQLDAVIAKCKEYELADTEAVS